MDLSGCAQRQIGGFYDYRNESPGFVNIKFFTSQAAVNLHM
jgi:hypothetical protein